MPVISLSGDRHSSRVGQSLLTSLGLESNAVFTVEQYVERGVAIASETAALSGLRKELRTMMECSALCSTVSFAKKFENALILMLKGES